MGKREMIEPQDFILNDILEVLLRIESKMDSREPKKPKPKPKAKTTPKPKPAKKSIEKPVAVEVKSTRAGKTCSTCGQVHEFGWEYGVCARRNKKEVIL